MVLGKTIQGRELLTMKKYATVLYFLSSYISRYDFNKIVESHGEDKAIRTLSTENLFKIMIYAQITKAFSLYEIVKTLDVNGSKIYYSRMKSVKVYYCLSSIKTGFNHLRRYLPAPFL
jgi:hypothetical protein